MNGKGQQTGFLFLEDLGDGAGVVSGPRALMSHLVAPLESLAVKIGEGGEGARGEEILTYILDGPFDAPFFISSGRAARTRGEVVVRGEFQEAGVEVNGIAIALQDHAAEVVGL